MRKGEGDRGKEGREEEGKREGKREREMEREMDGFCAVVIFH